MLSTFVMLVQVRGEALRALNVAYTIGSQRPTAFPIDNLVRMLMFRNSDEASSFIQHYGLAINERWGLVFTHIKQKTFFVTCSFYYEALRHISFVKFKHVT